MCKFSIILFDLDGTLIDSTSLILEKYLGIPLRVSFEDMYPGKENL